MKKVKGLTKTQSKILKLALIYPSLDALTEHLLLSKATIKAHLSRIYRKLEIEKFSQLVSISAMEARAENTRLKRENARLKRILKEAGLDA